MHAMKASNLALAAVRVERATEDASCISPALAAKGPLSMGARTM